MKKRKKYAAVLLLSWALGICPAQAAEDLELYARSAVLMDGSSGRILYGKGGSAAHAHGQHHQDHDLYSGPGRSGRA